MKTRPCPHPNLAALLNGQLSESEQLAFENHLEHCETCRNNLEQNVATKAQWNNARLSLSEESQKSTSTLLQSARSHNNVDHERYRSMLTPTDDPRMLGRIGTYEISGLLGQGGMGVVFKGFDPSQARYVAIKLLAPHFANSAAARRRFLREAQAAAAVVHEHVIDIYAVSEWQGTPYLVMPILNGASLQKRIEQHGVLQLRELLRIGMQVASGLAAAHSQGLIHRDVKPSNIMMKQGVDRVVLSDFGLARAVDDVRLTKTDTLVGTPQYMSPEQTNDEALDFRTDLFSLGSVLYEASTGRPAFQAATSYGVLRKINESQPQNILELNPDIPDWFETIVTRLMSKDPADRFQSAEEVSQLLQQCLSYVEQPHLTQLPDGLRPPEAKSPLNRRSIMFAICLAAALSIGAGAFSILTPSTSEVANEPAPVPEVTAPITAEPNTPAAVATEPQKDPSSKYKTFEEAWGVGVVFHNARNFKASREPLEVALKLAKDDKELKLKVYGALLPSYRLLPEFEPFQTAAEYVIKHHKQNAYVSITRRNYLAFAYQRGQFENLIKRYEKRLKADSDEWMSLYLLSEIYANGAGPAKGVEKSKKAIELLNRLAKVNPGRFKGQGKSGDMTPAEKARKAREKARLASQYMRARDYENAAKLYEEIAPLDKTTHAWNLKEAASAWLKLDKKDKALQSALAAEKAPAEARNDQLTHFFERNLGDIFMKLDKPKKAIPHYRIAVEKTKIEGYVKDTKASLAEALEKAGE